MQRYCLTLDLKDDVQAIAEYKQYHAKIWPEIKQSLLASGVDAMEIYLLGTRMFMIMEVEDAFSFSAKEAADAVVVLSPQSSNQKHSGVTVAMGAF